MLLLKMPSLPIVYASTSGNVLAVCERVVKVLAESGIEAVLHRVEITPISVLQEAPLLIFATSTWEHGALNPYFKKFYEEMKTVNCAGKFGALIGLGDIRYEPVMFCRGMELVRERFLEQGGQELLPFIKINGEPYTQLDTIVTEWTKKLAIALLAKMNGPMNA